MPIELPSNASGVLERGIHRVNESALVLAYGLKDVSSTTIQETCDRATETYARSILHWPEGRLAKPDVFKPVEKTGFTSIEECASHYIQYIDSVLESSPQDMPEYPEGFIVLSEDQLPDKAALVLAYQLGEDWFMDYRLIPIDVKLAMEVCSVRMVEKETIEVLDEYRADGEESLADQRTEHYKPAIESDCRFAAFTTVEGIAMDAEDLLDPANNFLDVSDSVLSLFGDPDTSMKLVSFERMKEIFPVICQDQDEGGFPDAKPLHRKVFVCCDNDNLEADGALVIQMEWDGNIERSKEELQSIGASSVLHETRVDIRQALKKAREIADSLV